MTIFGHRTRSVFDRYNIVSDADLKEATIKRVTYQQNQGEPSAAGLTGTVSGTIVDFQEKRANREIG
jgi:hypothetical protein